MTFPLDPATIASTDFTDLVAAAQQWLNSTHKDSTVYDTLLDGSAYTYLDPDFVDDASTVIYGVLGDPDCPPLIALPADTQVSIDAIADGNGFAMGCRIVFTPVVAGHTVGVAGSFLDGRSLVTDRADSGLVAAAQTVAIAVQEAAAMLPMLALVRAAATN